ncbi:diguanylate cyclase [Candidatus Auribacterota bacterium]
MKHVQRLKKVTKAIALVFFLLLFAYAFVLMPLGVFSTARLKTQDIYFRLMHIIRPVPEQAKSVVVVAIDDESLQKINKKWPWDRDIYAGMLEAINGGAPRVIGFDIIFIGESVHKKNDERFRDSIKNADNVVLASYYSDMGDKVTPYPMFRNAARSDGMINKPRDMDYEVRKTRLFIKRDKDGKEVPDYSFEIKLLCGYYGCSYDDIEYDGRSIILKESGTGKPVISIPVENDGTARINYLARKKDFTVIPIWKIVNGLLGETDLKDKIILIGQTNEIIHDIYPTPLRDMAGVVINANSILTVLSGGFLKQLPNVLNSLIFIVFSLTAVFLAYRFTAIKGLLLILLEIISFIVLSAVLFYNNYAGDFFSVIIFIAVIYIAVIIYKYICLLIESIDLKQDAITDGLTGLYILRYFNIRIQNEFERAKRYGSKLSLIMMDIDHFKTFNDEYGHEKGNTVLAGFAATIRETFRKSDILVRYGGEEFCALLPGVGKDEAIESAERFRKNLQDVSFNIEGQVVHVNVSLGVVSFPDNDIDNHKDFIEYADKALYQAKNTGRNRTVYYGS